MCHVDVLYFGSQFGEGHLLDFDVVVIPRDLAVLEFAKIEKCGELFDQITFYLATSCPPSHYCEENYFALAMLQEAEATGAVQVQVQR